MVLMLFRFKVVVAGPFGAGKTTFIKSVSDSTPLLSEAPLTGGESTTTVAFDLGQVKLTPRILLLLFGAPGQRRFRFMWDQLANGMDALLLLVDSTDAGSWPEARMIYSFFTSAGDIPTVICANKQDLPGAHPPEAVAEAIGARGAPVLPLIARDRASARLALKRLTESLYQHLVETIRGERRHPSAYRRLRRLTREAVAELGVRAREKA